MIIRNEIIELEKLGRLPDESNDSVSSETLDLYANLLHNVTKPINLEEAEILIKLFPEIACYGSEWTLLHLFESIFSGIEEDKYIELIAGCPSEEWRETLTQRLENKKRN